MPSSSLITGVVLDARGQPVAGARISWLRSPAPLPDVTLLADDLGCFTLVAPVPGPYTLRCDSDTHGGVEEPLQAAGQPLNVVLRLPR